MSTDLANADAAVRYVKMIIVSVPKDLGKCELCKTLIMLQAKHILVVYNDGTNFTVSLDSLTMILKKTGGRGLLKLITFDKACWWRGLCALNGPQKKKRQRHWPLHPVQEVFGGGHRL